jgi:hypothetical protein
MALKAIGFIQSCNVDSLTPADNCTFSVHFHTSDGAYSSSLSVNVDITQNEAQILSDIKGAVATTLNAALGTSLGSADIRMP